MLELFNRHRTHLLLGGSTFALGASVMAIEMTASRLIAPHFGASLFVWTALIVTVLIAMAAGYWLGGKAAERGAGEKEIGFAAAAAAVLLFFGTHAVPRWAPSIGGLLAGATTASVALFFGALLFTIIAFALPVFMLAAAGPMMLKTWAKGHDVGAVAGRYFAVSTTGSAVGTVAPSMLLVPVLGATATMDAVSGLLLLVAALMLGRGKRLFVAGIAIVLLGAGAVLVPRAEAQVLEERESPYQLIRVLEGSNGTRYLSFNEGSGIQSEYHPTNPPTIAYFDAIGILPLVHPVPPEENRPHKGLILGLAGGSIPRAYERLSPDAEFDLTGVEIDPAVIDIARRWFALDETGTKVVEDDARTYLARTGERFDSIAIDAYSVQLYIPSHLATREFFSLVRSRLAPGGVASLNVNASSPESRLLKALVNSLAAEFPHVQVLPVTGSWNYIVLASESPIDPRAVLARTSSRIAQDSLLRAMPATFDPEGDLLTDDRAPTEFMTDAMILEEAWN